MLPKSVVAQIEAAEQAQKQLGNPEPAAAEAKEPEQTPAPEDKAKQPDSQAQPAEQPSVPTEQNRDEDAAYWRHRFQVLQGKYNSEIAALREENQQLKEQAPKPIESKAQDVASAIEGLSEQEIEDFGPDLIDLIKKVSGQSNREVEAVKQELNQIKEANRQDAEARFWTDLERLAPKFREINADPKFHAYLAEFDSQTGEQRQQTLVKAQKMFDAYSVAKLFNTFTQNTAAASQPRSIPEEKIQPSISRSESAPNQGARSWSRGEITEFYTRAALGKYSEAERAAIEAEIFEAQRNGRVIG
jgi:uncharacterized protein YfkK (UPF0435 family)